MANTPISLNRRDVDRFLSRFDEDPNGCWLWNSYLSGRGYGQMYVAGKVLSAHRIAYFLAHGPIPEGLQVDHLCHERRCVNPAHLRLATNAQNQENRATFAGLRGVYRDKSGHWRATVRQGRANHYAGTFDTAEEADAAARQLRAELGFRSDGR